MRRCCEQLLRYHLLTCCAWMQTSSRWQHVAAESASSSGSKPGTEVADAPGPFTNEAEAPAVSGQEQVTDAIEVDVQLHLMG